MNSNKSVETTESTYTLKDCIIEHQLNPATFDVPPIHEIENLQPGCYAKLIFIPQNISASSAGGERMWVHLTEVNGDRFAGVLDNNPVLVHELKRGDVIRFERRHIASIITVKNPAKSS